MAKVMEMVKLAITTQKTTRLANKLVGQNIWLPWVHLEVKGIAENIAYLAQYALIYKFMGLRTTLGRVHDWV